MAVAVHLEDVDVVGDAIEQRAGQTLGSQSFRPVFTCISPIFNSKRPRQKKTRLRE